MHFCIFNLSCYALLKANVYIFQSCTWLLTLFPTFSFFNSKSGISKGSFGRSFVLFNFQDFFYCRFRQLLYSITSFRFCQALFSNFFKFFFKVCFSTWCDVYLLYHVSFRLSSPFSRFFQSSFKLFSRLTWQLIYITTFSFICQQVWEQFVYMHIQRQPNSIFLQQNIHIPTLLRHKKVPAIISSWPQGNGSL